MLPRSPWSVEDSLWFSSSEGRLKKCPVFIVGLWQGTKSVSWERKVRKKELSPPMFRKTGDWANKWKVIQHSILANHVGYACENRQAVHLYICSTCFSESHRLWESSGAKEKREKSSPRLLYRAYLRDIARASKRNP